MCVDNGSLVYSGDVVVRALQRKLQDESPRVVLQTLILAEALVKNGSQTLHAHVGTRSFLHAIAALTDGSLGFDVQQQSLLLIKQWADAFASSADAPTAFQDEYRQLKLRGADFPELANDAPVFTPPPSSLPASVASVSPVATPSVVDGSSVVKRTRAQQLAKLHDDLAVVMQNVTQLRDLWTGGVQGDALEDALDFLRQCQPRMNTLIEGGIMGKIDEVTLEKCLTVRSWALRDERRKGASTASHTLSLVGERPLDQGAGRVRSSSRRGRQAAVGRGPHFVRLASACESQGGRELQDEPHESE